MAKKAKDYYSSPEAKLLSALFDTCLSGPLAARLLDLLNALLASNPDPSTRRYLAYCIHDRHVLTRLSYLGKKAAPLRKRCDELRHYLSLGEETAVSDQRFYKRIAHFTQLCHKSFGGDVFARVTSQQSGSVDLEENMREVLSQMELEGLTQVFKAYHINVPDEEELRNVRAASEKQVSLEEYMIEVLI